jgi:hypothetical protein
VAANKRSHVMRVLVILALIAAGMPMRASADDAYPIGGRTSLWQEAYVIGSYRHLGGSTTRAP